MNFYDNVYRYTLESVQCKVLEGECGFVAQLNPNRASNRRPPQAMLHLEQPFSHDKFNFTKVDLEKEGVFQLKHMQDHSQDRSDIEQSSLKMFLYLEFGHSRNVVVINVSPLEFGASLLLPSMDSCLPQLLTVPAVRVAMDAVLLSGVRNMKAAFNSLCAFASVNHLHWHLYYLQKHSLK